MTRRFTLSPDDLFPGVPSVDKKRELFQELPSALPISVVLPDIIHIPVEEYYPHYLSQVAARPRYGGLPCRLGPINPCPKAVHMETFSSSVFKVRG